MVVKPHPKNDTYLKAVKCGDKLPYDDYWTANAEMRRLRKVHNNPRLRPYKCVYCDKYHLGTHNLPIVKRGVRK